MADQSLVGGEDPDAALQRVREALGVRDVPKKAADAKVPAKKPAKKAPTKKVSPPAKKVAAKKAAKKPAKKAPSRKQTARKRAAADPAVPDEVAGRAEEPAQPAEIVALDLEAPAARAHSLFVQGLGWTEIALRTGYASEHSASAAVALYLQRGAIAAGVESAKARAEVALEANQRVKAAFFERAMLGDKDAAMVVLRANELYYKMAGLEKTDLTVNSKQTIVISGGADMADQLRKAAEQAEQERRRAEEAVDADIIDDHE